eukprot:TRINITY_DN45714_c0_g1_i1.p1 TRINITY_DN45714_c0_g1~~TRINITY_DN45714_c0_g1_i1.p1  ORF type:complete len:119 (+),score=8.02 TRINITY_DN45714_c0_g1_i1:116-472(+)
MVLLCAPLACFPRQVAVVSVSSVRFSPGWHAVKSGRQKAVHASFNYEMHLKDSARYVFLRQENTSVCLQAQKHKVIECHEIQLFELPRRRGHHHHASVSFSPLMHMLAESKAGLFDRE